MDAIGEAASWFGLVAVGFAVGAYAGAIGAGGGFLLAPVLLRRHPEAEAAEITMATLAVVLAAASTYAAAGARAGRLDVRLALVLGAAALPAVLLGAGSTTLLPREAFAVGFALLLLALGVYLTWQPTSGMVTPVRGGWRRELVDRAGDTFVYRLPLRRSVAATALAAFVSTLAGIGGGVIYTPLVTRVMRVPHALAVPLAQTLLALVALAGVLFHLAAGSVGEPMSDAPPLAIGMIAATRLGRWLHRRLGEGPLMRALAAGLIVVALRTALFAF